MANRKDRLIGIGGAVLIHLLLIGLLAFNIERRPEAPASQAVKPIVQARVVSEEEVMEPRRRRQAEEDRQRRIEEEKRRAEEAKQKAAEEQKRKAEAEKQRQAELKKKQEAEKARLAEQERQRKIEAEKQRKAEAERKAAEERKKAEAERKAAEERKKAEAERKAAEERKKAEAERKRQEAEEQLKQAMAAEVERIAEEEQRMRAMQLSGLQEQYKSLIKNKVERNWRRPTGSHGTHCRVVIHQIPGGEVIDVRLTECDGDVAFQRSVEAAVRKASPLPPAPDPEVFDREIEFVFEP